MTAFTSIIKLALPLKDGNAIPEGVSACDYQAEMPSSAYILVKSICSFMNEDRMGSFMWSKLLSCAGVNRFRQKIKG